MVCVWTIPITNICKTYPDERDPESSDNINEGVEVLNILVTYVINYTSFSKKHMVLLDIGEAS